MDSWLPSRVESSQVNERPAQSPWQFEFIRIGPYYTNAGVYYLCGLDTAYFF